MKANKSIHTNSIHRLLVMGSVVLPLAFGACSSVGGTAGSQTPKVASYLEQSQQKPDNQPVDSDSDPTYEWFY
jgi:hypothetical protein